MKTEVMGIEPAETATLSPKAFLTDQSVRWCPGCGDYAILSAMSKALPRLGVSKEKIVFVSGIGCAARFPYYINTYGFHTIHGRGPAIATGLKMANPDLIVWEVQGDGDALAIGTNHFMRAIRRNVDINILVFNNEIYGLTKGQCSPTSAQGLITQSTPYGVSERPFSVGEVAMGARGTFFARTVDTNPAHMTATFLQAAHHPGTAVVEILQNCVIFNDNVHGAITDKETRSEAQLHLQHGEPMRFGKELEKGLRLNGLQLEVVTVGKNGVRETDLLVHDANTEDATLHTLLTRMAPPHFPVALGVIRSVKVAASSPPPRRSTKTMNDLLNEGETWQVT